MVLVAAMPREYNDSKKKKRKRWTKSMVKAHHLRNILMIKTGKAEITRRVATNISTINTSE